MRWTRYEPLKSPTHALDPLRNRIAELREGGRPKGLISTRVETQWAERTGSLWWKSWVRPHEVLVYEITWIDNRNEYLYDNGVANSDEAIVSDLFTGKVTFYGDIYEVRWLSGNALADAEVVMGVADLRTAAKKPPTD